MPDEKQKKFVKRKPIRKLPPTDETKAAEEKQGKERKKRREEKPEKIRLNSRVRDKLSKVAAFLIVLLLIYAFLSLVIFGVIYYSFNSTPKNSDIYSLKVIYDGKTLYSMSASRANNEYGLYIPFTNLTSIASFGIAVDGQDVTLFLIGTDNRISCTLNSSLISINDNPIRMSAPILYSSESDDYLIPVSLLENYINGINVSYDDDKMVCSVSPNSGKTDISLKLLLPEPMDKTYFPESYKTYLPSESSEPAP